MRERRSRLSREHYFPYSPLFYNQTNVDFMSQISFKFTAFALQERILEQVPVAIGMSGGSETMNSRKKT